MTLFVPMSLGREEPMPMPISLVNHIIVKPDHKPGTENLKLELKKWANEKVHYSIGKNHYETFWLFG